MSVRPPVWYSKPPGCHHIIRLAENRQGRAVGHNGERWLRKSRHLARSNRLWPGLAACVEPLCLSFAAPHRDLSFGRGSIVAHNAGSEGQDLADPCRPGCASARAIAPPKIFATPTMQSVRVVPAIVGKLPACRMSCVSIRLRTKFSVHGRLAPCPGCLC